MDVALVTKLVVNSYQGNAELIVHFTVKGIKPVVQYITNKMEHFSFKSGCAKFQKWVCQAVTRHLKVAYSVTVVVSDYIY